MPEVLHQSFGSGLDFALPRRTESANSFLRAAICLVAESTKATTRFFLAKCLAEKETE